MPTLLRIGPADRGRPLTLEEFTTASFEEGYKYELIDGRLTVAPAADIPQETLEDWIADHLKAYGRRCPHVINKVSRKSRVFLPAPAAVTAPEPDVSAYHDFPLDADLRTINWEDVSPILVVEIISPDDPNKDLVRNATLYHQVASIREYWVVDPRPDPNRPSLCVFRRRGRGWRRVDYGYGDIFTTPLLPDFSLVVDPRRPSL
jgi:Uma2 family endonuclease